MKSLLFHLKNVIEEFYIDKYNVPISDIINKPLEKDSSLWNEGILKGDHPKYKFDNIEKALKEIKGDL